MQDAVAWERNAVRRAESMQWRAGGVEGGGRLRAEPACKLRRVVNAPRNYYAVRERRRSPLHHNITATAHCYNNPHKLRQLQ